MCYCGVWKGMIFRYFNFELEDDGWFDQIICLDNIISYVI